MVYWQHVSYARRGLVQNRRTIKYQRGHKMNNQINEAIKLAFVLGHYRGSNTSDESAEKAFAEACKLNLLKPAFQSLSAGVWLDDDKAKVTVGILSQYKRIMEMPPSADMVIAEHCTDIIASIQSQLSPDKAEDKAKCATCDGTGRDDVVPLCGGVSKACYVCGGTGLQIIHAWDCKSQDRALCGVHGVIAGNREQVNCVKCNEMLDCTGSAEKAKAVETFDDGETLKDFTQFQM